MTPQPPTPTKPTFPPSGMDHDALPPGTRFGEFEILRVLGVGGFGIVYLARDHSLERDVALKEYMPASLAARGQGPQITVRSSSFAETYAIGLRSFINEARLLARFDHPSLVKVYRFWEDNATAYMVMPFLQGVTLRDTRRTMAHAPNEAWVRSVVWPLLSALELLHKEGVYHRDIAPDNILLPPDGPPVLLDFGAARRVISDRTQSLTAILKPSYAPIEQYAEMVQLRQGPWTDLYALGAVVHYLLFGVPPSPATARAVQDEGDGIESRVVPGISPLFLETLAWMLAVRPNQRPQNGEQLRAVLEGRAQIPPRGRPGITIPGGTMAPPAALPVIEPARVAAPLDVPRPSSFSPTTQMPTARNGGPSAAAAMSAAPVAAARRMPSVLGMALAAAVAIALLIAIAVVAGRLQTRGDAAATDAAASATTPAVAGASAVRVPSASIASPLASAPLQVAAPTLPPTPAAAPTLPTTPVATPASSAPVAALPARVVSASAPSRASPAPLPVASSPGTSAVARVAPRPPPRVATDAAAALPATASVRRIDAPGPGDGTATSTASITTGAPVAGPTTVREDCGKRVFIALAVCMDERCELPRWRNSQECVRILARKAARENR